MPDCKKHETASPRTDAVREKTERMTALIRQCNTAVFTRFYEETKSGSFSSFGRLCRELNCTPKTGSFRVIAERALSSILPFVPAIDEKTLVRLESDKSSIGSALRTDPESIVLFTQYLAAVIELGRMSTGFAAMATGLSEKVIERLVKADPILLRRIAIDSGIVFMPRISEGPDADAFYGWIFGADPAADGVRFGSVIGRMIAETMPDLVLSCPTSADRRLAQICNYNHVDERRHEDTVYEKIRNQDEAYFLEENGIRWSYAYLLTHMRPSWKSWLYALHEEIGDRDSEEADDLQRYYPETDYSRLQITYFLFIAAGMMLNAEGNIPVDSDAMVFAMNLTRKAFLADVAAADPEAGRREIVPVTNNHFMGALVNFLSIEVYNAKRNSREDGVDLSARWLRAFGDRNELPYGAFLVRCPHCRSVSYTVFDPKKTPLCAACRRPLEAD